MKTLISLVLAVAVGLAGWIAWQRRPRKHDPVEYFAGWDGYGLPIRLTQRITKEEAEAIATRGNAYLIGYFDENNRLIRDVKMLRGKVFFEHVYTYYPSGRLSRVKVTNPDGVETEREYRPSDSAWFFW
jgi:Family of unknown function (DUF6156)